WTSRPPRGRCSERWVTPCTTGTSPRSRSSPVTCKARAARPRTPCAPASPWTCATTPNRRSSRRPPASTPCGPRI
ncbi:MAG: hypothetical protein AVDCRST_MAG02-395, partial [uncultured Rubrobacteraceae bacterium]